MSNKLPRDVSGVAAGSGKDGNMLLANADRTSTNSGDALKELFNRCSPCLILIDE